MVYREVTQLSIFIRVLTAIIVGGIIGLERGAKNRPAGLRTYMLVCVGACLIMLTNQCIYQATGSGDPMRLGAQVVSGIGFLGAGTIIVTKHNQIKGLTTAAGLWASAGVGLAAGVGFYEATVTATVGIYLILTLFQRWEHRAHKKIRLLELYVELDKRKPLAEFTRGLRAMELQIEEIQIESEYTPESGTRPMLVTVKSKKRAEYCDLAEKLRGLDGIVYLEIL